MSLVRARRGEEERREKKRMKIRNIFYKINFYFLSLLSLLLSLSFQKRRKESKERRRREAVFGGQPGKKKD